MVSETLKKTLQVEKIVISVFESENNMYRVYNKEGVPESCECDFVEDAAGLSGLLIKRKDCISFYRIENDRDVSKLPSSDLHLLKEASIVLVVPMVYREELRGMILLGPKMSGEVYAQEDRDILLTVAGQTAVAVENARLYKQELERQREHEELELARKIQQDLLPNESPPMEGLEVWGCSSPATEVGGDYFDYIKKGPQSLLVFLGDVSGKGMPAALYMSKVQGMVQVAGSIFDSPRDILMEVNRKIFEGIEKKSFITMLSVLFDPTKKCAVISRAGHNPLMIFRGRQNRIEDVRPEGPGLGVVDGMAFDQKIEEVSVTFSTGDYFIIYSDGLTEAINPDRELFGEDRVQEIILKKEYSSPRELGELLMKSIGEYRQDAEQNDDITLVIVKIN
jgi:serine phosphatase RsbU (regulator of sigma subunit)